MTTKDDFNIYSRRVFQDQGEAEGMEGRQRTQGSRGGQSNQSNQLFYSFLDLV